MCITGSPKAAAGRRWLRRARPAWASQPWLPDGCELLPESPAFPWAREPAWAASACGWEEKDGLSRAPGPGSDGLSSVRMPLLGPPPTAETPVSIGGGGCQGHPAEGRTPDTVPRTPGLKAGSLSPKGQSPSLSKVCFHGICESCMCFSGRLRHPLRGTPAFWTGGSSRRHRSLLARAPGKRKPPARQLRPSLTHAGEREPGPLPHATSSGAVFRNTI